jgi:hypothetical protein
VKGSSQARTRRNALAALGFDPDTVLLREPGMLLDARFLGALHRELEEEFGAEEAALTLYQIGFLHGLQDAHRVAGGPDWSSRVEVAEPMAPPLAMRCLSREDSGTPGALELVGSWPQQAEAEARLSALEPREGASCFVSAGYTSGWLSGTLDADLLALETECAANGADACRFVAREVESWREDGDADAAALLEALPYDAFRELVSGSDDAAERDPGYDAEAGAIHVWGPVMVVPFAGLEEGLRSVRLIGRDPAAREVSVVVVDLTGTVPDEAFGALDLEQLVESIEARGAEAIFAGGSSLSSLVVDGLERAPLMTHKDLHSAIAAAFQVADARRRPA